ncbi:hypothetical protein IFM89_025211 [Coptis chinensis]|uniref:No apical meristem-associated C-terminal domain-containing protein n=1 Tax=Coptis chinensis TaxID=261450 RepID=A0A835HEY1_9MAGN|nr:hypothetical protein IFM89_025211 [Coptis chinensis]
MENEEKNWSEQVENLVDTGNIDEAISLLETENPAPDLKQLSCALTDLANLYASRGFSLKSDELQTRAFLVKQRAQPSSRDVENVGKKDVEKITVSGLHGSDCAATSTCNVTVSSDDDATNTPVFLDKEVSPFVDTTDVANTPVILDKEVSPFVDSSEFPRPDGVKKQKQKKKKACSEMSKMVEGFVNRVEQRMDRQDKLLETSLKLQDRKYEIMSEKNRIARMKEETKIMAMDTTVLPPERAVYFKSMQDDIIRKWNDQRDWEAVVDRGSVEVLSPQNDEGVSKLSLDDTEVIKPKRRGRGSFLYKKNGLYSDQQPNVAVTHDPDNEADHHSSEENTVKRNASYGTNHVLVLADITPSTRTTDLEKHFENFRDRGFVIHWVNDTVALAVFRTPSIALEARNTIHCPFNVRPLSEDDSLLCSIARRDLEPPVPRPKTSVRTAQRLIAQGMGRKLSSTTFGSSELRKQEEARRDRIVTRQMLRDDAWGPDD